MKNIKQIVNGNKDGERKRNTRKQKNNAYKEGKNRELIGREITKEKREIE